jgi:CRP/FNR family transcriptional regulator, cyclic AMP receptor protein
MTTTIDDLRRVSLFQDLQEADLRRVLEIGKEVTHPAGSPILAEDDRGVGMHLIREGTASVHQGDRELSTMGPGTAFGEMSLLDGKPRSATVVAETDVVTFAIPSWEFQRLLDQHPQFTKALLLELVARIRRNEGRGED